jgi:hypothetical protein
MCDRTETARLSTEALRILLQHTTGLGALFEYVLLAAPLVYKFLGAIIGRSLVRVVEIIVLIVDTR